MKPEPTTGVLDRRGHVVYEYSLRSGDQKSAESALGFPRGMLASHTENRAARMAGGPSVLGEVPIVGDPYAGLAPAGRGYAVVIEGIRPPCGTCMGAMNRAAASTGAIFVYLWSSAGRTNWWQSK